MSHDPTLYPNPTQFKPERFLAGGGPPPDVHAFGFGRRYEYMLFMFEQNKK